MTGQIVRDKANLPQSLIDPGGPAVVSGEDQGGNKPHRFVPRVGFGECPSWHLFRPECKTDVEEELVSLQLTTDAMTVQWYGGKSVQLVAVSQDHTVLGLVMNV